MNLNNLDKSSNQENSEQEIAMEIDKTAENDSILNQEIHNAKISGQGLVADKFDDSPQIPVSSIELSEFEGKESFSVKYGFTAEEVKKALIIFQKNTIYKRNTIYSLIIAVLFITYLFQVIGGNQSKFGVFMCALTIAVLGMIWYFPLNHIKSIVKSVSAQDHEEIYDICFYDNAVVVGENESKNVFYYKDGLIRAWETDSLIIIGYAKQRIFVVPKRCSKEKTQGITDFLRKGLGKNYKVI